ncbi:hypothetical protein KKB43_00930 [Patescibacteria group bacterium]|nr:hypothetical protein [Patescibacteria group bacterium]MBU4579562.1 hypothetical protein [Patescibacteria group bacterium]
MDSEKFVPEEAKKEYIEVTIGNKKRMVEKKPKVETEIEPEIKTEEAGEKKERKLVIEEDEF